MNRKVYMAVAVFVVSLLICFAILLWNKQINVKKIEELPPITNNLFACKLGDADIAKVRQTMSKKGLVIFDLDSASN